MDCNLCMIHPEKCNYPKHDCPDTWEHEHCKKEHIVYLANSSGLKVGITRINQIPTRWIDQGASQAVPLFKVYNRYHSGVVEVLFKEFIADKTNWRKMLGRELESYDMMTEKESLLRKAEEKLNALFSENSQIEKLHSPDLKFTYPIIDFPKKLTTLSFDKEESITGSLIGIKGQYLLFDHGVLNIRKHSGYKITLTAKQ